MMFSGNPPKMGVVRLKKFNFHLLRRDRHQNSAFGHIRDKCHDWTGHGCDFEWTCFRGSLFSRWTPDYFWYPADPYHTISRVLKSSLFHLGAISFFCQKPGALYPVANATIKALRFFCLCPPKFGGQRQAICFTCGRCVQLASRDRNSRYPPITCRGCLNA